MMSQYATIIHTTSENELNKLLSYGWDHIETNKKAYGDGTTMIEHVIGLSYKTKAEGLLSFLKTYESITPKNKMFEAQAEKLGEDFSQYETGGFLESKDDLIKFMVSYEMLVNGKLNASFYKNEPELDSDSDSDFDDDEYLKL